jgi:FtsZ-interacting cell division protein ZipA
MPELRIILLVAGILFIAGIAGYEWWRSRGARPQATLRDDADVAADAQAGRPEPRSLPEINVVRESRVSVTDALPIIELGGAEKAGAQGSGGISVSDDVAIDVPNEARETPETPTSTQAILRAHDEPYIGADEISEVRVFDEQPVRGPQLVLAWPSEAERRIVTLRVLPRIEPRFAGRALRQAFASAGFWHGPLDIYHLPDARGRVVLSAAALAQPGTFDPSIMDSQRFSGLNMFAVLPGPLPERETFDELVHAARALAERLEGLITDQHGEELTPARVARLRQSLEAPPQARVSEA